MPSISVVIPVLNDAAVLERLLTDLGSSHLEVVVVVLWRTPVLSCKPRFGGVSNTR